MDASVPCAKGAVRQYCFSVMIRLTAATGRSRLDTLTLADLHSWLVVHGCSAHAFLDLSSHG
jgi:hypothetical protein